MVEEMGPHLPGLLTESPILGPRELGFVFIFL